MPRRTTIQDQLPTSSTTVRSPVRPPVVGPTRKTPWGHPDDRPRIPPRTGMHTRHTQDITGSADVRTFVCRALLTRRSTGAHVARRYTPTAAEGVVVGSN